MVEEVVKVEVKAVAEYAGHNITANGSIDLNVKCNYGELTNYIQLVQMLNNDIKVGIKIEDRKPFTIGTFRLKQLRIDHDGMANIKLNSITDFVEVGRVNELIGAGLFKIMFKAEVMLESNEEEEEAI